MSRRMRDRAPQIAVTIALVLCAAGATLFQPYREHLGLGDFGREIEVPVGYDDALGRYAWSADLVFYRLLRDLFPQATYVVQDETSVSLPHLRRLAEAGGFETDSETPALLKEGSALAATYFPATYGPLELRGIAAGEELPAIIHSGPFPGRHGQRVGIVREDGLLVVAPATGTTQR